MLVRQNLGFLEQYKKVKLGHVQRPSRPWNWSSSSYPPFFILCIQVPIFLPKCGGAPSCFIHIRLVGRQTFF